MRVYNFSPGPSALPLEVLEQAAAEMTDARGTGQSVMEMSHRSADFKPIIEEAEALLRELMGIGPDYAVLFLQGGASLQFAMVPLNLAAVEPGAPLRRTVYVDTGIWAAKAAAEAAKYTAVTTAASSKDRSYSYIPRVPPVDQDAAYCHLTLNNTIVGTRWPALPDTGRVPLVADVSSCVLSEPIDTRRFALLYAGAQKNLGPAGATVVIVRRDLLDTAPSWIPTMLRYDTHAAEGSMFNTPPCYCVYVIGLVLEWVRRQGGVEAMARRNREKAAWLYGCLDASTRFAAPVEPASRSLMNIVFTPREQDPERRKAIETRFVKEAREAGLVNLAGHRLVGGMRASVYNAMPLEGVKALTAFIERFERTL